MNKFKTFMILLAAFAALIGISPAIASAHPNDNQFLDSLAHSPDGRGVGSHNGNQSTLSAGYAVCDKIHSGLSAAQVRHVVGASSGLFPGSAEFFTRTAIDNFCAGEGGDINANPDLSVPISGNEFNDLSQPWVRNWCEFGAQRGAERCPDGRYAQPPVHPNDPPQSSPYLGKWGVRRPASERVPGTFDVYVTPHEGMKGSDGMLCAIDRPYQGGNLPKLCTDILYPNGFVWYL